MPYTPTLIDLVTPADSVHGCFEACNTNFTDLTETLQELAALVSGGFNFAKTLLTGGTTAALDSLAGVDLTDGDTAIVFVGSNPTRVYIHVLDADNGGAEDSPYIIAPDTPDPDNANKRWVLSARVPRTWKGTGTPTTGDDYADGVRNGDLWLYAGNGWICVAETIGAAVWRLIPQLGTGSTNAAAGDHNHSSINIASTAVSDWTEAVQDTAGGMWASNTETGMSVAYDDAKGKLNAAVLYGSSTNTACVGNDARLSDARPPEEHGHYVAGIDCGSITSADAPIEIGSIVTEEPLDGGEF